MSDIFGKGNALLIYKAEKSLTKENFWNKLYDKHPKGMKVFCDWIDAYKKATNWDGLFNAVGWFNDSPGIQTPQTIKGLFAPKYHDLPFAMQIGIWIAFLEWISKQKEYSKTNIIDYTGIVNNVNWKLNIEYIIDEIQSIKENEL